MEIIRKKENGNVIIDSKAMEEMAEIALKDMKEMIPFKEAGFISCKLKDEEINIVVNIRLVIGSDVDATCKKIQQNIAEHIDEMTSIKLNHIDIVVHGFESKEM